MISIGLGHKKEQEILEKLSSIATDFTDSLEHYAELRESGEITDYEVFPNDTAEDKKEK